MKIAVFACDGQVAKNASDAAQVVIVTVEEGVPNAKEILDVGGQELTSVVLKLASRNIDVLIAGDISTILQSALRMLGISLYPGCEGDVNENIAAYLMGEELGDPSKIVIPEDDEDDPMNCMHDCARCMAECANASRQVGQVPEMPQ